MLALLPRGKGFDVRYAHPPSPSPARQYTVPAERKTPLHPTQARPAAAQPPRCTNFPCCQHWSRRPAQQVLSAHPPTHAPTRRSRVRCGGGQGEVWLSVAGRGKCGCGVREVCGGGVGRCLGGLWEVFGRCEGPLVPSQRARPNPPSTGAAVGPLGPEHVRALGLAGAAGAAGTVHACPPRTHPRARSCWTCG